MRNLTVERVKKYVSYGEELFDDAVEIALFIQVILYAYIVVTSDNYKQSILFLVPFIIFTFIIFFYYKTIRKPQARHSYLFTGLECIVLSLTFQCGVFLFTDVSIVKRFKIFLVLFCINLCFIAILVGTIIWFIEKGKDRIGETVTGGVVAGSVAAGGVASTGGTLKYILNFINEENEIVIFLAIGSIVCSCFSIVIMKYYYAKILEKIEKEKGINQEE